VLGCGSSITFNRALPLFVQIFGQPKDQHLIYRFKGLKAELFDDLVALGDIDVCLFVAGVYISTPKVSKLR
jgi:hypothetical protein